VLSSDVLVISSLLRVTVLIQVILRTRFIREACLLVLLHVKFIIY